MKEKHKFIDTFTNVEFECSLDDFANAYDSIIDDDVYEMYGYITLDDYYSILGIDAPHFYLGHDYGWRYQDFEPMIVNVCVHDEEPIYIMSYNVSPRKIEDLLTEKIEDNNMFKIMLPKGE